MAGYSVTYTVVDNATKQIDTINRRIAAMRAPIERQARTMQRFLDVSGLKKVADGFGWIARSAGMALRSLTAIVPVLGALTSAATITGMVKLVSSFAAWGNQLQTNADQIGITTDQLQLFQDATTRAGGNAQDMTETLKNLHKISADAFTGMNNEAAAYFRRFNISLTDANGKLKSATELLPEVFAALDSLKDPADRSRVAAALLGDAQAKLYEEYKQSGKPLQDWLALEEKHQRASTEQLKSLNDYRLAMSSLETSFNQLGRQVSATLAQDLTPLVKSLDEWVQAHQPQIVKAVDDITKAFEQWMKGVDWSQVKQDIDGILKLLKTMLEVAEAIGKAIEKTMFLFGLTNRSFTKQDVLQNSPWYAQLTDEQKKMVRQQVGVSEEDYQKSLQPQPGVTFGGDPMGWLGNRLFRGGRGNEGYTAPSGAGAGNALFDRAMRGPPEVQPGYNAPLGLGPGGPAPPTLSALPGDTSWGDYGTRANNPGNMNFAAWQNASGRFNYTDPQTGGGHTMAVFNTMEEGIAAQNKLLMRNQEKYGKTLGGALHGYAENPYTGKLGIDPSKEFDVATADPEVLAKVLEAQYKIEGRKGSHSATHEQILAGIAMARQPADTQIAQAPAVPPPAAAPPVNGSVNVDITHRNPPADSFVTASASGAVDLAPLRTENPQLSFATA